MQIAMRAQSYAGVGGASSWTSGAVWTGISQDFAAMAT